MPQENPLEPAPVPTARTRRFRLGVGAAIVLGLVVLSAAVGMGIMRGQAAPLATIPVVETPSVAGEMYVHVLGQVEHPGLYVLTLDARVVDAIAAAGGTLAEADLAAINLARPLTDGEQLIVPLVGPPGQPVAPAADDGLVNLNTADIAELDTLPRVGPAIAQRIVDWRDDNGGFRSVDDLLSVPGIGDKMLAGLRDLVSV